jgi:hypothetical protein
MYSVRVRQVFRVTASKNHHKLLFILFAIASFPIWGLLAVAAVALIIPGYLALCCVAR